MRKYRIAGLLMLSFPSVSIAADLQSAKVPPPILASWTGLYIGANVGANVFDSSTALLPTGAFGNNPAALLNPLRSPTFRFDTATVMGGGQIGYNYAINPSILVGLETDFNSGLSHTRYFDMVLAPPLVGDMLGTVSSRVDYFGTVRGRLGYTFDKFLFYGTGGLSYGHVSNSSLPRFTAAGDAYPGSAGSTKVGWTVGGGVEVMVLRNISVKGEFLHVDLGRQTFTSAAPPAFPGVTYDTRAATAFNVIRVGLNYKFDALAAPIVARY